MTSSVKNWHGIFQPMVAVDSQMNPTIKDYEMLLRDADGHFPGQEFLDSILNKDGNLKWINSTELALQHEMVVHPDRRVFINLDPAQLTFEEIWDFLGKIRQQYGSKVAIEITERRERIPDIQYFYSEFHRLKEMGFDIAIDDVSSGANSYEFVCHHLDDISRIKLSLLIFKQSSPTIAMQFAQAWQSFAAEKDLIFVLEGVEDAKMAQSFAGKKNVLQQGFYWNDRL